MSGLCKWTSHTFLPKSAKVSWDARQNFKIPFPYPLAFSEASPPPQNALVDKCCSHIVAGEEKVPCFDSISLLWSGQNVCRPVWRKEIGSQIPAAFSCTHKLLAPKNPFIPKFNLGLFWRIPDFKLTLEQMPQICPTFKWPPIPAVLRYRLFLRTHANHTRWWLCFVFQNPCVFWKSISCLQQNGEWKNQRCTG